MVCLKPSLARRLTDTCRSGRARFSTRVACVAAPQAPSYTGTTLAPPKQGHHFLHIDDFSKEQLLAMLATGKEVKARLKAGDNSYKPFAGNWTLWDRRWGAEAADRGAVGRWSAGGLP